MKLTKQQIQNLNQLKNWGHLQEIDLINTIDLLQSLLVEANTRINNNNNK